MIKQSKPRESALAKVSKNLSRSKSAPKAVDLQDIDGSASKRRPGRPRSGDSGNITRNSILRFALKLAKKSPLQDLSIITVARSMGVTPALIHYYIGGRDWLTSGVMNLFYKETIRKIPSPTGDWKHDLQATAKALFDQYSRYAGIAAYAVANSRFRVYQLTAFGDRDYGIELLELFVSRVRAAGLSIERTGIYANQMLDFVISTGNANSHHLFPSEHRQFLEEKIDKLDQQRFPNVVAASPAPLALDGRIAFTEGCYLFILGIDTELTGVSLVDAAMLPAKQKPKSRRPTSRTAIL